MSKYGNNRRTAEQVDALECRRQLPHSPRVLQRQLCIASSRRKPGDRNRVSRKIGSRAGAVSLAGMECFETGGCDSLTVQDPAAPGLISVALPS